MNIRTAGPEDAETLFQIQRVTSLAAYAHVFPPERYPFPDEEVRAEWRERLADPETTTLIAQRAGRTVGYVAFAREVLASLFVLPEHKGAGIGSALHDAALAAQRGLDASVCRLWVLEANTAARAFYERRGWFPDGRRRTTPYPPHPVALGYSVDLGR